MPVTMNINYIVRAVDDQETKREGCIVLVF